ncbi:molybdenum cofactor biosynthesis protein MoaE [Pseudooceanicola aestuarii]|uniref:molybdenum cofactor biosynthesis protein MoaE n=1 Tax=Pseudooceanicola aestuarii TaxID=2697319 RepID=UPI0013D47139|nr:molybdenum cofactor biosynthesis protein MoaE [Pseudooceanicola aestuarii]
MITDIRVQSAAFAVGAETDRFAAAVAQAGGAGAIVTFTGLVRDLPGAGGLDRMVIEHYPGMTEKALKAIAQDAAGRWPLEAVLILHRHGELHAGAAIMMVATASAHRAAAFAAADFLMDYLKSRAPFWKKEITADGSDWVAAKDADEAALTRW